MWGLRRMSAPLAGPPPAPDPGLVRSRLALVGVLGAGLALRVAVSQPLTTSADWEADGVLWAWADAATRPLASDFRPAGLQRLWEACGWLAGPPSLAVLRLVWVGLSLAALGCAWQLTRVLLRWRGAPPEALPRARLAVCLLWAVIPALARGAPRPVAELVTGALLCLVASAWLRFRARPGALTWLWLCATGVASVFFGGVVPALVLTAGLLAYLVTLPMVSATLLSLAAWTVAVGAAAGVAHGTAAISSWRPDTGPAYALAALVEAPTTLDDTASLLPVKRGDDVWRACGRALRERPLSTTLADLGGRARALVAPDRFAELGEGPRRGLGLVDAALAGVLLVLAVRALAARSPSGSPRRARWPVALAGLVWIAATVAAATGPFALSGVLLLALAAAAAGERPRTAAGWALPIAGGLLLAALAPVRESADRPSSRWLEHLGPDEGRGRQVAGLLASAEPLNGDEHGQLAEGLVAPAAPFLHRPLLAREHAQAAVIARPTDDDAVAMLVRAEVECLRFVQAEDLAKTIVDEQGVITPRGRMLADWVRDKSRRARLDGLR